jgi:PUA domain protein
MRRYTLKKKEKKNILREISRKLKIDIEKAFGPKPVIEIIETQKHKIFCINGLSLLARTGEEVFPTLLFTEYFSSLPKIVLDMGAVPHVCNGADIMAPGIRKVEGEFREGELVLALDERNRKPIAIARSLFDSETLKTKEKGKVFKNLHYVSDDVWNAVKRY